jgi:hypothetical protein
MLNVGSSDTLEIYRASKNGSQIAVMTAIPMNNSILEHEKLYVIFQTIFGIEGCHCIATSIRSQVTEGGKPYRFKG